MKAERQAEKRRAMARGSYNRAEGWVGGLGVKECQKIVRGAIREASSRGRLEFEVGNWNG